MNTSPIAVTLTVLAVTFSRIAVDAGDGKKEPSVNGQKIERMIDDLGSKTFSVRNAAEKHLRLHPGVLPYLKKRLSQDISDLEKRRRVESMVYELSHQSFKNRFKEIIAQPNDVPIDLLADLVFSNQRFVGNC